MTHAIGVAAERQGRLILSDGRTLKWHEWGQRTGTPVLFCTGAAMSGALGFGHDALATLGARLIAVDRPGLGDSSIHLARSFASWIDDTRELLAALAIERLAVVGFSQGAPFALALGAAGVATAVALVSAQDDVTHPVIAALLPAPMRTLVQRANGDADALSAELEGVATADWLHELVISTSGPVDRAFYQGADFAAAYRHCLTEGFRQGTRGYVQDLLLALGPWPFAVEQLHVPVHLWYGAHDHSAVHSPDQGATLATRLPHSSRTVVPDVGGSVLWTHALPILTTLLQRGAIDLNANGAREPDTVNT